MRIRRASVADAEQVSGVLRAAFYEFEPRYTRAAFVATTPDAERVCERLDEGPTWIADDDGQVVGTVSAVARPLGVYVRGMAVLPASRGRGIGNDLMREVERFARSADAERMYLSTTPFLFDAIRLYERLGFRRNDEPPHDLFGTPLVTMAKRLRAR